MSQVQRTISGMDDKTSDVESNIVRALSCSDNAVPVDSRAEKKLLRKMYAASHCDVINHLTSTGLLQRCLHSPDARVGLSPLLPGPCKLATTVVSMLYGAECSW